jgi:hypothetical protein
MNHKIVLEKSMNNHTMQTSKKAQVEQLEPLSGKQITLKNGDKGFILHGEHNTIGTEKSHIVKVNQQEWNPILQKMQDAAD